MTSYTAFIAAVALLAGVQADYNGAASSAADIAGSLAIKVSSWSSGEGLAGALGIQEDFPGFSKALEDVNNSVSSTSASDVDINTTKNLISQVESLLDALSSKSGDFQSAGASSIVAGDLKGIASPASGIINGAISILGKDAKWGALSSDIVGLEAKINDANKAYGVDAISFNSAPSANAGSSSSAGSSVASPASSSSVAASGSSKSMTASTPKNASSPAGPAGSAPKVHNGAMNAIVGGGAAALGAAALLL